MAAGDYTIEVSIDDWTDTIDRGEQTAPGALAVTMEPLNAAWAMTGPYPSQPSPTTVTFGLHVPDVATGPQPVQGSRVEITLTTPDHDPGATGILPVFEFVGLITSVDATPRGGGIAYNIGAADYRSTLGETRVGDEPWPAESLPDRLDRIVAAAVAAGVPVEVPAAEQVQIDEAGFALGPDVAARDVDSQPIRELFDDLFASAAMWIGVSPSYTITGRGTAGTTFLPPSLTTWLKPIIAQHDDAGDVSFPVVFIPAGLPDVDAALPYTVDLVAGELTLVRKAITPDTSLVAWIPATAIDSDSVTWRQDKATNTNRVRAVGPDLVAPPDRAATGSVTAEYADLVAAHGPNEITVSVEASQNDYIEVVNLIYALLGTHYDASPRWAMDTFTIKAGEIADGDQWPRLFDPRAHAHIFDQAAGKFVLITDPAAKWNLHDRADYFGRLAGATLNLAGGKITWTATLAHRLPIGAGMESVFDGPLYAADPGYTGPPTHHPITHAELAAGANPTYLQAGDLTYADMQLVEG